MLVPVVDARRHYFVGPDELGEEVVAPLDRVPDLAAPGRFWPRPGAYSRNPCDLARPRLGSFP